MSKSQPWIVLVERYVSGLSHTLTETPSLFRSKKKAIKAVEKALGFSVPWDVYKTMEGAIIGFHFTFEPNSISYVAPGIRSIRIDKCLMNDSFYVRYVIAQQIEDTCKQQERANRGLRDDDV